jgi:hypothetical protein
MFVEFGSMRIMGAVIPGAILALALAGCDGSSVSHPKAATSPAATKHVRTYPEQAADTTLCNTYNADIQSGDTYDISQAL